MPDFYPIKTKEGYETYVICPINKQKIKYFNNSYRYNFDFQTKDFIGKSCRGSSDPRSDRNCPYLVWGAGKNDKDQDCIKCSIPSEKLNRITLVDDGTGQFKMAL